LKNPDPLYDRIPFIAIRHMAQSVDESKVGWPKNLSWRIIGMQYFRELGASLTWR
jgi:hypothetical protein